MSKIKFTDKIENINPERLISSKNNDKEAKFFLVLGLFYNDLKNLLFHLKQLEDFFKETKKDVASPENGEYGGMKIHLERLMISIVYEFFNFLEKNVGIKNRAEFKLLLDALNQDLQERWRLLWEIASHDKKIPKSNFGKALFFIRNTTTFHYDSKILSKGFIEHFYNEKKNFGNTTAFYNIGDTMETTRFYYCDGAIQGATKIQIEKFIENDLFIKNFEKTIGDLNFSLMYLLKEYIRQRPSKDFYKQKYIANIEQ